MSCGCLTSLCRQRCILERTGGCDSPNSVEMQWQLQGVLARRQAIERQAAAGAAEADVLVMVVDGQAGVTAADEEIATWLRRTHPRTPVLLVVNKCENARLADVQARHTGVAERVKKFYGCQDSLRITADAIRAA